MYHFTFFTSILYFYFIVIQITATIHTSTYPSHHLYKPHTHTSHTLLTSHTNTNTYNHTHISHITSSKLIETKIQSFSQSIRSWNDQWPIGNGRIGALIGGSISSEVIPLSLEGFFVRSNTNTMKQQVKHSSLYKVFQQARMDYLNGEIDLSTDHMAKLVSPEPLGMFQYICDLTLVFSPVPLMKDVLISSKSSSNKGVSSSVSRRTDAIKSLNRIVTMLQSDTDKHSSNRVLLSKEQRGSRRQKKSESLPKENAMASFREVLSERHELDTITGIARGVHVATTPVVNGHSSHKHIHTREWFASNIDDVMVGSFSCRQDLVDSIGGDQDDMVDCLHAGLRLSREMSRSAKKGAINLPESQWRAVRWSDRRDYAILSTAHTQRRFTPPSKDIDNDDSVIALSLSLESSSKYYHRGAEVCGALICTNSKSMHVGFASIIEGQKFATCSKADRMVLYLAAVGGGYAFTDTTNETLTYDTNHAALRSECWMKIESALDLGYENVKQRHVAAFSKAMTESAVIFGKPTASNASVLCGDDTIESQVKCLRSASIGKPNTKSRAVANLVSSAFWFGKYLLLSSATESVPNLQGLWCDGPESAWNGDYHLNINMQMMYWPSNSVGLGRYTLPPLKKWLTRMTHTGSRTARELYNCPGWVGHGFTDDLLDMGIRGSTEWALCVTCGTWMAQQLWEYSTYSFDVNFLNDTLLPLFRSLAKFFINYLFRGPDGYMHSGPTTSPENSYRGNTRGQEGKYYHIALSPGLDMSILRQAANSLKMITDWKYNRWLELVPASTKISDVPPSLVADMELSNSFLSVVQGMKYSANPAVANGIILEYPIREINFRLNDSFQIVEGFDKGHRHFSSLHWLYPGTFLPATYGSESTASSLLEAASRTLREKVSSGGGHTGWSAVWESALWSRLRQPAAAWSALKKYLLKYTSSRLMGLHPNLKPSLAKCGTCFKEAPSRTKVKKGMATPDGSVFQIDGSVGFVAAVCEMILQSHEPGIVSFLPAIPAELSRYGKALDIRARGGYSVSFQWSKNRVTAAVLEIKEWHPWLLGQIETSPGYFRPPSSSTRPDIPDPIPRLLLSFPNRMISLTGHANVTGLSHGNKPCARQVSNTTGNQFSDSVVDLKLDSVLFVEIDVFPCNLFLCSDIISREKCAMQIKHLVRSSNFIDSYTG